ncbi:isochorismatase family protein [Gryllotalpicola reticulitermitis]|uniref:Isochorismatase family protein n=1 Tax=Gryllotalpicola reticulitermitis TaxID=1184153 RepID=A0ABV8Q3L2_9MICO
MSIQLEQTPALVVIDLQEGLRGYPTVHPFDEVVANSAKLADAFRAQGLPVVLVNVEGAAPGRTARNPEGGAHTLPPHTTVLVPELNQQASDITVTKRTLGAFLSTDLDAKLKAVGATQIVLTGISTTSGVESTARSAYELGYHVGFVLDAMTDVSEAAHDASIEHQFPKLGELGTTDEVLQALSAR